MHNRLIGFALAWLAAIGLTLFLAAPAGCHADPSFTLETCGVDAGEGGSDASDASTDVLDASDASDGRIWCDGADFLDALQDAYTDRITACCADVGVDLSSPSKHASVYYGIEGGWLGQSNAGATENTIGLVQCTPSITFHADKAADCLAKVSGMTCTNITEAEYNAITAACFGVFSGNLAIGDACLTSIQCGDDAFCDLTAPDAGAPGHGFCRALLPQGSTCASLWATHEYPCSHRGLGSACDGTCIAPRAEGQSITSTPLECAAGMLRADYKCASVDAGATYPNLNATTCGFF